MKWRHSLLAGSLALVSFTALAGEAAEQWVQKMLTASRQASYQGQSVLVSGGKVTSLTIYHAPVENEVWERVVHMSGEPAEILRKGSMVSCLHPGAESRFRVGGSPIGKLTALEESFQTISRYYRFVRAGSERVAGYPGIRINVEPLDSYRFGYSLWLEENSGVLLKSQTNPADGDPLEVFEFVALDIGGEVPRSAFNPAPELQGPTALTDVAASSGAEKTYQWQAGWLPEGFRQAGDAIRLAEQPDRSMRVFTDGLAAFSVFFEPSQPSSLQTTRAHGATVAVNRILPDAKALVTVVGEVPLQTAAKVAENIKVLEATP